MTAAHAAQLADIANRFRVVFEAAHYGDTDRAASETYRLLPDTHACPQLDLTEPGWNLHFHGDVEPLNDYGYYNWYYGPRERRPLRPAAGRPAAADRHRQRRPLL